MPILHIRTADPAAVAAALDELLDTHEDFFAQKIPAVLDLSECVLEKPAQLHQLVESLRKVGLLPCAVVGNEVIRAQAIMTGLGTFGQHDQNRKPSSPPQDRATKQAVTQERQGSAWPTRVIKGQVRSGQQIHAPCSDIVILGSVHAGAEVMADGSVHVHGALRGRVLAGAHGHKEAKIFCHALEAELVAIAGYYRTAEELDTTSHGRPACIWLDGENVVIDTVTG